jgi:diguanylate cyclase (GGDEF)-like protein
MNDQSLYVDELTGVYNRRYLNEQLQQQTAFLVKSKTPFSVVMIDIDHFKEINDVHGHLKGDEIIKAFAQFLKSSLRISDTVVRYGGDEFICLMPASSKRDAEHICGRIAQHCRVRPMAGLNITLSAGIASHPDDGQDLIILVDRADQALYDAKRSGRDRVGVVGKKKAEIPIKVFIDRIPQKETMRKTIHSTEEKIRAAVVSGVVGAGKTRLSREVLNELKRKEIIWADCIAFEEGIAYFPIREMIKYHINRLGHEVLKALPTAYKVEVGKLVPEIHEMIQDQMNDVQMIVDKYRLYEGIRRVVELGEGEKIIVIDNIQWVDTESVEVLKYLMRTLHNKPIVFIYIYRSEEKTEILEDFFCHISREHDVNEIKVEPFSHNEIREAIRAIIGDEPHGELFDYITKESGGIPFYIEEIMRVLLQERHLALENDTWRFSPPPMEIIPKNLVDIAISKYRMLDDDAHNVVDIASVIGSFDINLLKSITGFNEGRILGIINDINRSGLIKIKQNQYDFSEMITRNALYNKYVKGPKGKDLHLQVARLLEKHARGHEQDVAETLASHFYHAGATDKGLLYCMIAGDNSRQRYANEDACRFYTWAIDLLHEAIDSEYITKKITCLEKRQQLLRNIGEYQKAMNDCDHALRLAQDIGDVKLQAMCRLKKAGIHDAISEYDETLKLCNESMVLYKQIDDKAGVVATLRLTGAVYYDLGEDEKAKKYYEESVELAREVDDSTAVARSLMNLGNCYYRKGDYNQALELYGEAHRTFKDVGDKTAATMALGNIANIYHQIGDNDDALKLYEEVLQTFREIGIKWCISAGLINAGECYRSFGEYDRALNYFSESFHMEQDLGSIDGEIMARTTISTTYLELGLYDRSEQYIREALTLADKLQARHLIAACYSILGEILCERGDYKQGEECYKKGYSYGQHSPDTLRDILSDMCDLYLVREDLASYEKSMAELEQLYTTITPKRLVAVMDWLKGRFYILKKDFKQARKYLSGALSNMKEQKEKLGTAKILLYLGDLERGEGNTKNSREYYSEGLSVCNSIGAKAWFEYFKERLVQ